MTATLDVQVAFQHCAKCGIPFGMTADFQRRRRDDHEIFFCPAGHNNFFPDKSEAEKLRDQLAALTARCDQTHAKLEDARKETKREKARAAAARGELTKVKTRVHNGVCPDCHRTFQNLARHMKTKHTHPAPPAGQ